jgi:hypothetical protein
MRLARRHAGRPAGAQSLPEPQREPPQPAAQEAIALPKLIIGFRATAGAELLTGLDSVNLRSSKNGPADVNPQLTDLRIGDGGVPQPAGVTASSRDLGRLEYSGTTGNHAAVGHLARWARRRGLHLEDRCDKIIHVQASAWDV